MKATVSLAKRASSDFTPVVRSRGTDYFLSGQVSLHDGSATSVDATVRGSEPYQVSLRADDGDVLARCSCPYFDDHGVCEHIFATLLAADESPYLSRLKANRGSLSVLEDDDEDDPLDEPAWEPTLARAYRAPNGHGAPMLPRSGTGAKRKPAVLDWRSVLPSLQYEPKGSVTAAPPELAYFVDLASSRSDALSVEVARCKKSGGWTRVRVDSALVESLPDPADRAVLALLRGTGASSSSHAYSYSYSYSYDDYEPIDGATFSLSRAARELVVPMLCRTGRLRLRRATDEDEPAVLSWDDGPPWQLRLRASPVSAKPDAAWDLTGGLRRDDQEVALPEADLVFEGGLMILHGTFARFDDGGASSWLGLLRQHGRFRVTPAQRHAFIEEVYALPRIPVLDLPQGWVVPEVSAPPTPRLRIRPPKEGATGAKTTIFAEVAFDYDRFTISSKRPGRLVFDSARRRLVRRDPDAEQAARLRLLALDFRPLTPQAARAAPDEAELQIPSSRLSAVVRALVAEGWPVEAAGKLYRKAGAFKMGLSSGIDWFDLHAKVDFEGVSADLVALLAALRRGETMVVLGDGSLGVLPEEWLERYGLLAELGTVEGDHLRFKKSQVGVLDALLAAQPDADVDATFRRARDELRRSSAIVAADPPASFRGELRPYQREGLGWLRFLERTGFGGCLADDMGLGKTVQVLALLTGRRALPARARAKKKPEAARRPSIVVAPRSLVFNWKNEAARFAPELRVLVHSGSERLVSGEHFEAFDLVLTTYGTLRRDAPALSEVAFDYAILDEAQAIKNDRSDTAKAARLLRADHRLALSGTPVENHLGELWSLFDFLNPGMLGRAALFKSATASEGQASAEAIGLLARALRPFLLRRTKAQVAKDLPERTEKTLECELEGAQRKLYDELRAHYRDALLKRVKDAGMNRSKIHVLEAILRLRQAACHPGLLDKERRGDPSAKLEVLFDELPSLREKQQKALVFSQFTSLLSIVRERLDAEGIAYEYLDGQTHDRQARVERFQSDPSCLLFLVSLKAGGLGLNLTAAEYVFLLDPWWNPAVEAQAIDRAHRIGQTRPVFAYRMIARDTIEERIAELQRSKRQLAASVIEGDGSLIRDLTADDLDLLLS